MNHFQSSGNRAPFRPILPVILLAAFLIPQLGASLARAGDLPSCNDPALDYLARIRCQAWRVAGLLRDAGSGDGRRGYGPVPLGLDRWAQIESTTTGGLSPWPDSLRISYFEGPVQERRLVEQIIDHGLDGLNPDDSADAYLRLTLQGDRTDLLKNLDPNLVTLLNQDWLDRIEEVAGLIEKQGEILPAVSWQTVAKGLELAKVQAGRWIRLGDPSIFFLRIDPERYSLVPYNYMEQDDGKVLDIEAWAKRVPEAMALFNAGLYYPDKKYIGLLVKNGKNLGGGLHATWKALLLSGGPPGDPSRPPMVLWDLQTQPYHWEDGPYRHAIQSFMLLEPPGRPRVRQSDNLASRTVLGQDDRGRMVVVFVPGACTLYELALMLQAAGLGLKSAMSMDGGFQAQLLVHSSPRDFVGYGSWVVNERNQYHEPTFKLAIPTVVAVIPRQ